MIKFILYFLLFYFFFKILRRLLFGPPPKRKVYVNWGSARTNHRNYGSDRQQGSDFSGNDREPIVGNYRQAESASSYNKRLEDIKDADFEEIKNP